MHISISKRALLWTIAFLIGFIMLSQGISAKVRYSHAVPFSELDSVHCLEGSYVVGTIDDYLRKSIQNLGSGSYSGVSATYLTYSKTYDIYNVPIANNHYIRIMVADSDTKRLLANENNSGGVSIYFEGKIVDTPIMLNEKWYEDITEFDTDSELADFMVKQTSTKHISNIIYGGLSILICCLLFLFAGYLKDSVLVNK